MYTAFHTLNVSYFQPLRRKVAFATRQIEDCYYAKTMCLVSFKKRSACHRLSFSRRC